MGEDYFLVFFVAYFLGVISPFIFKSWILPKFSDWLQEKVGDWRKPIKSSNPKKHTSCPECGAWGRHKKTCSRGKKK